MQISNNLEERLLRYIETRPLNTLLDMNNIESITESINKIKKLDKAAIYDESARLRDEITTLQQSAQNSSSALSMLNIANDAMNQQLDEISNITNISNKFTSNNLSQSEQSVYRDFVEKDLLAIKYIAQQTEYNYMKLLDGSYTNQELSIFPNSQNDIKVSFQGTNTEQLGRITYTTSGNITNNEKFTIEIGDEVFSSQRLESNGTYDLSDLVNSINEKSDKIKASYSVSSLGAESIEETSVVGMKISGVYFGDIDVKALDSDGALVSLINSKENQTQVRASLDGENKLRLDSLDGRGIVVEATSGLLGLHLPGKVSEKILPYNVNSTRYLPNVNSNLDSSLYSTKVLHSGFSINGVVLNTSDTTISNVDDLVNLINTKSSETFVEASASGNRLKLTMIDHGDTEASDNLKISYTHKDDLYVLGLDISPSSSTFYSSRSQEIESGKEYEATDNYMPEFTITMGDGFTSSSKTISAIANNSIDNMIAHINSEFGSNIASKKENISIYNLEYNEEGDLIGGRQRLNGYFIELTPSENQMMSISTNSSENDAKLKSVLGLSTLPIDADEVVTGTRRLNAYKSEGFFINDVVISPISDKLTDKVEAINSKSMQTGVTAEITADNKLKFHGSTIVIKESDTDNSSSYNIHYLNNLEDSFANYSYYTANRGFLALGINGDGNEIFQDTNPADYYFEAGTKSFEIDEGIVPIGFKINGVTINDQDTFINSYDINNTLQNLINDKSALTGVTASFSHSKLHLNSSEDFTLTYPYDLDNRGMDMVFRGLGGSKSYTETGKFQNLGKEFVGSEAIDETINSRVTLNNRTININGDSENRVDQINNYTKYTGVTASLEAGKLKLTSDEDIYFQTPSYAYDAGQTARALGMSDALFNDNIQELKYSTSTDTESINYGRLTIMEKDSEQSGVVVTSTGSTSGNAAWSFKDSVVQIASINLSDLSRIFTNEEAEAFGNYANTIEKREGVNNNSSIANRYAIDIANEVIALSRENIDTNIEDIKRNYQYIDNMMKYQVETNKILRNYITKLYGVDYVQDSFYFTKQKILQEEGSLIVAQSNIDRDKSISLLFGDSKSTNYSSSTTNSTRSVNYNNTISS